MLPCACSCQPVILSAPSLCFIPRHLAVCSYAKTNGYNITALRTSCREHVYPADFYTGVLLGKNNLTIYIRPASVMAAGAANGPYDIPTMSVRPELSFPNPKNQPQTTMLDLYNYLLSVSYHWHLTLTIGICMQIQLIKLPSTSALDPPVPSSMLTL